MAWADTVFQLETLLTALQAVESGTATPSVLPLAQAEKVRVQLEQMRDRIGDLLARAAQERERSPAEKQHDEIKEVMQVSDKVRTRIDDADGWPTQWIYESKTLGKRVVVDIAYGPWDGKTKPILSKTKRVEAIA